jgi:hypothetical protein
MKIDTKSADHRAKLNHILETLEYARTTTAAWRLLSPEQKQQWAKRDPAIRILAQLAEQIIRTDMVGFVDIEGASDNAIT